MAIKTYTLNPLNPIRTVDGVYIKTPSTFQWSKQDVSDPDAGRTEDALMHKKKIAEKVKIELAWQNIPIEDVQAILAAFSPEYIQVNYLDPKEGGYVTKTFYVGDQASPMYNSSLGVWSNVAFNIIER